MTPSSKYAKMNLRSPSRLKDDRGAEVVAAKLLRLEDRLHASKALQDMGSVAEKAVAKYIEDRDFAVRIEVCRILKAIGTSESKSVLEKARGDSVGVVGIEAKNALKAIDSRK
jgi:hypothetical protein